MYIAVLDQVPDFMVPTLVAHTAIAAHMKFTKVTQYIYSEHTSPFYPAYMDWLDNSFKKVVLRVNQKEFDKIAALEHVYLGHENTTLDAVKSCAIPLPMENDDRPNVLRCAKMWKPVDTS